MNIKSRVMRFNARNYYLSSKSRSHFTVPREMAHKNFGHLIERYLSIGIASDRRFTRLDLWSNVGRRNYQWRFYCSEAVGQNADAGGDNENKTDEGSHNEAQPKKPSAESKQTRSRLSKRGARFRNEYSSRIVPWEKIPVSFDTFPYYTDDDTKALLMECVASHLKQKKFRKYGSILKHSSNRIQLQSIPGTDLYRERLVSAVARELQVPLLKLDSSILPPYDISQHYRTQLQSDNENRDSDQDLDSEDEDDDDEVDKQTSAKPHKQCLKRGDRVEYVGKSTSIEEVNNRTLSSYHRGEVHEVHGDKVAVIFNVCGLEKTGAGKDEKSTETTAQETVTWHNVKDVRREDVAQVHDCFIALELLYEVLEARQPIVVYFPDSFFSNLGEASNWEQRVFFNKAKEMFNQLKGRVVLICGQNKREGGSEVMEKSFIQRLQESMNPKHLINEIFTNVMCIKPPKGEDLDTFIKQIEEDRTTVISECNLSVMHQVLKAHKLLCTNLEQANTTEMILTREEVEKIVAWATNHYLSSSPLLCVKKDVLHIPHESLKLAIMRLKEQQKKKLSTPTKRIKDLAEDKYEQELVSAVVCAGDIGVKFDDVGALEDVKKTLYETVILPMRRPELFSHGNLKRSCKGVLLFGPPGTGKTLMAKALATEAGANFINITTATLTSMWWGETERLTRALFSYARKLAPAIIFLDEVDSLFATRGRSDNYHGSSRLNEFMAAWDGLISKDSQRILVIGATNRPFDLDDAVLRRMPRRVYVGLPDARNRAKILKVLLLTENLEPNFSVKQLAEATEGYSGDDLKNLCIAAAYRPVKELLEQESKGENSDGPPALRPLQIDDYIISKAKVRPSVSANSSSIKMLREWDGKYGEGESECIAPFGF